MIIWLLLLFFGAVLIKPAGKFIDIIHHMGFIVNGFQFEREMRPR